MMEYLVPLSVIGFLILLNGLFVAAEFAIVAVPRTRVAQLAESGSSAARHTLTILSNPRLQNRYITTAQVGITIASLGLGGYGEHTLANWLLGPFEHLGKLAEPAAHTVASIAAVGLLTYLHVVIGEMIPKSLALQSAESTMLRLIRPMALLQYAFYPAVWLLNRLANGITHLLGVRPEDRDSRWLTPDELEFIVEESSEGGYLEPSEQLFIENIFDLRDRTARQVMTPRNRVVGIPAEATQDGVMQVICGSNHSRYPVFEENLDDIRGILHIKDVARQRLSGPDGQFSLREIARAAVYVPETLPLSKLFVDFRRERLQMAIVIDESGGTAGIVTLEDLIEEVVGEIQDEFDQEISPVEVLSETRLRLRGDLILDEVNQYLGIDLGHPDADTIGGLVMTLLGRIPQPKDWVAYRGVTITVESVQHMAVVSVLVNIPAQGRNVGKE